MEDKTSAIWPLLPAPYQELFTHLFKKQLTLTLVGGGSRQWYLGSTLASDLDWEVGSLHSMGQIEWRSFWEELAQHLRQHFPQWKVEWIKDYLILKCQTPFGALELSSPRQEIFDQRPGHRNFRPQFVADLNFAEGVKRRDFTLNSIGLSLTSPQHEKWLDPLQGREHLKQKKLYPCSADFFQDPVRFLRAVRFASTLGLSYSAELTEQMHQTSLEGLSFHYLFSEAKKSHRPLLFLQKLLGEIKRCHPQNEKNLAELLAPLGQGIHLFFEQEIHNVDEFTWALGLWSANGHSTWPEELSLQWGLSVDRLRQAQRLGEKLQLLPGALSSWLQSLPSHDFSWAKEQNTFQQLWECWRLFTAGPAVSCAPALIQALWPSLGPHLPLFLPRQNYQGRELFEKQKLLADKGEFAREDLSLYRFWAHLISPK